MSQMHSAGELLRLTAFPAAVAVVGCGGKTTFIESLACELRHKKVLITPTTKILPMESPGVVLCKTLQECRIHTAVQGIQCLGILGSNKKLRALPSELLAKTMEQYDLILLEADGSRGLPCKGWLPAEPVVPEFSTHTVGIVTLKALNEAATEHNVLRLPEFSALTGTKPGHRITLETLCTMLCAPGGMFKNSAGKRYVFINQIESSSDASLAQELAKRIQKQCPNYFSGFAWGSAKTNLWKEV